MNRLASRNPDDFEDRIEAMRDEADIRREEKRERELKTEGETEQPWGDCLETNAAANPPDYSTL